jgi:hypothetical protein
MTRPISYLDVGGDAIGGGYRVCSGTASRAPFRERQQHERVIVDTARDVAAAARLLGVPVLTTDPAVREACRSAGVGLITLELP